LAENKVNFKYNKSSYFYKLSGPKNRTADRVSASPYPDQRTFSISFVPLKKANPMTSRQSKIQENIHFRIMRILQENPDMTQRELAEKQVMSLGGLNYCLNALIDKGLVKMQNFANSKNKFKYVYLLTPMGIAEKVALSSRFLNLKMQDYAALKVEIEVLKTEVGEDHTYSSRKQAQ
jgi:EPS-associated MarR family transcriptional regulator